MSRTLRASKWPHPNSAPTASNHAPISVAQRLADTRGRKALWFAAVKPPMYTVAITPMLVGSFASYAETAYLSITTLLLLLTAAVSIIAWLNLTNDVFDFDCGIDDNKPESVVNLCGATRRARNVTFALANAFLAMAFILLTMLARVGGEWDSTVLVVMGIAVMGGYAYQGPPFRLGYLGLGEPITMFGWTLAVCAAYYSQISLHQHTALMIETEYPGLSSRLVFLFRRLCDPHHYLAAAALLVATPTTIILFCSHFHQYDDDKRAGKWSPIVRLGTKTASRVLDAALVLFMFTQVAMYGVSMMPRYPFYLSALSAPYAVRLANFVEKNYMLPAVVRSAKYYAVKFQFVHGMLLATGFLLTAWGRGGVASV